MICGYVQTFHFHHRAWDIHIVYNEFLDFLIKVLVLWEQKEGGAIAPPSSIDLPM